MRSRIPKFIAVLVPSLLVALGLADVTLWP